MKKVSEPEFFRRFDAMEFGLRKGIVPKESIKEMIEIAKRLEKESKTLTKNISTIKRSLKLGLKRINK